MTNREVIALWRHFAADKTGSISVQNSYSPKALLEYIKIERSGVIRDYIEKGKTLPNQISQTISCVKLKDCDLNECPFTPASGCTWLKTECQIPYFISLTSVSAGIGSNIKTFDYVDWDKFQYKKKSRESGNLYTTKDVGNGTYIYLYDELFLESITFVGIAEDPTEVISFCDKSCECDILDRESYISKEILREIYLNTWGTLQTVRNRAGVDVINDDLPNESVSPQLK